VLLKDKILPSICCTCQHGESRVLARPAGAKSSHRVSMVVDVDMFEDSLLESAGRIRTRRGLTTATSLALQSLLLAMLVSLPLFFTEALPAPLWLTHVLVSPPPPRGEPAPASASRAGTSEIWDGRLRMPQRIPNSIAHIVEEQPPSSGSVGVPFGMPGGTDDGVLNSILSPGAVSPPLPPKPAISRLRVSQGVVEGLLIHQVKPEYPRLALQTRTQGAVVLHAIIGRDGTIASLQVASGHPMLVPAAIDAVRQWRYRPYTLSGEPIEVETSITVNFVLEK